MLLSNIIIIFSIEFIIVFIATLFIINFKEERKIEREKLKTINKITELKEIDQNIDILKNFKDYYK